MNYHIIGKKTPRHSWSMFVSLFRHGRDFFLSRLPGFFFSSFFWMIIFPIFIIFLAITLEYSGLDLKWEALFYDASSRSWTYRNHWLFDRVIHGWGRNLNICAAGLWMLVFLGTIFHRPLRKFGKPMVYFLVAAATGPLIVGALKQITHIYTPWDIKNFAGSLPYIRLFDSVPAGLRVGEAFPSGHASGGYAFFSLYFLMRHLGSSLRRYSLFAGFVLGGVYGIGQQVRGAHFPSHDLYSMVICWYSALILYYYFYPNQWRKIFND